MGFCVPTNVIPNWMLVLVVLVLVGRGLFLDHSLWKLTPFFLFSFFFFISAARARERSRALEALSNGRLRMSSAAAIYLFICFNICLVLATLQHSAAITYTTGATKVFCLSVCLVQRLHPPSRMLVFLSLIEGNERSLVREMIHSRLVLLSRAKRWTFPSRPTVKKS